MAVYFVTGKLGSGKTLATVGRIRDYLKSGRRVATNLDINLDHLLSSDDRATVYRLPDKPRLADFQAMGCGSDDPDESTFGALVLDELGTWFNARAWSDKERAPVIDWCLHARKFGWDVYFVVQHLEVVDKQLRESLCEFHVVCRRLDRLKVPVLGIGLPKVHVARVDYGYGPSAVKSERWVYRARDLYQAYDTRQVFAHDQLYTQSGPVDMRAPYTLLSAWHLKGRYLEKSSFKVDWQLPFKLMLVVMIVVVCVVTNSQPRDVARRWRVLA